MGLKEISHYKDDKNNKFDNEKFISIDELIKRSKDLGINLGKGEPYNRIRYYTKMGWIPHMERKGKDVKGHYPEWVIDRLKDIENLRTKGLSNDKILEELKRIDWKKKVKDTYFKEKYKRIYVLISLLVAFLILFFIEADLLNIGKNRRDLIPIQKREEDIFP